MHLELKKSAQQNGMLLKEFFISKYSLQRVLFHQEYSILRSVSSVFNVILIIDSSSRTCRVSADCCVLEAVRRQTLFLFVNITLSNVEYHIEVH